MKISIAMAVYNGAQYISEQLQSIVEQTRLPDELVVVDDRSTDNTLEIVYRFADVAPFDVKIFRNEHNLGYCGNFNKALMRTTGDLVFLCDQDDVWLPDKLSYVSELAEENPDFLLIMNDAMLTDSNLREVGLTKVGQISNAGYDLSEFVMGCCSAVRRELLDFCMPIPSGFKAHDSWIAWFADGLESKIVDSNVLQLYRRHGANESEFSANSLTKMSRAKVNILHVRRLLDGGGSARAAEQTLQLKMFAEGIARAIPQARDNRRGKLSELLSRIEKKIEILSERDRLRTMSFRRRAVGAISLWSSGGYKDLSGMKSFARDILGR